MASILSSEGSSTMSHGVRVRNAICRLAASWAIAVALVPPPLTAYAVPPTSNESSGSGGRPAPTEADARLLDSRISWWMTPRTVADEAGRLATPNTREYVNPSRGFEVHFDLAGLRLSNGALVSSAAFRFVDRDRPGTHVPATVTPSPHFSTVFSAWLPEGRYWLEIDASHGKQSETFLEAVEVRDILVAAIGDSYSSGEGCPEVARSGDTPAQWMRTGEWGAGSAERDRQHCASHRSSFAASALLAQQLEEADPHTSVTFLFLSQSGGEIQDGGLTSYAGVENEAACLPPDPDNPTMMAAQVDQLEFLADGRDIDVLTVSFGGNDVGFANVISALVLLDPEDNDVVNIGREAAPEPMTREGYGRLGQEILMDLLGRAVQTGDPDLWVQFEDPVWGHIDLFKDMFDDTIMAGFDRLPDDYAQLAKRLDELTIRNVYVTEYPDPFTETLADGSISPSPELLTDFNESPKVSVGFDFEVEVDRREMDWALTNVVQPLNDAVEKAANEHPNWHYVGGIRSAFRGHGLGGLPGLDEAQQPIEANAERARWFVRPGDSVAWQGPDDLTGNKGTVHPNRLGHEAIAKRLYWSVSEHLPTGCNIPSAAVTGNRVLGCGETTFTLLGTSQADDVVVSMEGDTLVATRNGEVWKRQPAHGVSAIFFHGGAGDDRFRNRTGIPAVADGGAGRDVLIGGRADDILRGGDGADVLRGGAGDDALYGGGGRDRIFGGKGDDYIEGERGADRIWGRSGRRRDLRRKGGRHPPWRPGPRQY